MFNDQFTWADLNRITGLGDSVQQSTTNLIPEITFRFVTKLAVHKQLIVKTIKPIDQTEQQDVIYKILQGLDIEDLNKKTSQSVVMTKSWINHDLFTQ